jgi:3-oxoacyl-[acyl-carrier-protein] synthase II
MVYKRVVITGMGVISPIASGTDEFWKLLLAGTSGVRPVQSFDSTDYAAHIGGEVLGFDPTLHVKKLRPDSIGRASQLAIGASRMALCDSGIDLQSIAPGRAGVAMGTTSGEPILVEQYNDIRKASSPADVPACVFANYPCNVMPAHVATEFGLRGPASMIPNACAAGNFAIGHAFDLLRTGRVDFMLAGGADAFSRIPYLGFARLGAIAPEKCQPFDKNRKGMVPAEGAGMVTLETLEGARARGAKVYAEVKGFGATCDAHHMTSAQSQGEGGVRAMVAAMKEAGVGAEDIGYISAHGTGTPTNDRIESIAAHTLFAERAPQIPMSSIKSMLGHTMGAASAIEAIACALAVQTGWIPPTINYEEPDPECALDIVPNVARKADPRVALNNAYAFGGNNACLCVGRYE